MVSRKGNGGDANVLEAKWIKGGEGTKQNKQDGEKKKGGGEIGEEIFKQRGSSTMPQHKIVALLFVLHTLFLPLKHILHCARSIEIERCRCMNTERREGGKKQPDVVRHQTVTFVVVTTGMSAAKAASRRCAVSCVRPGQQALMTGGKACGLIIVTPQVMKTMATFAVSKGDRATA